MKYTNKILFLFLILSYFSLVSTLLAQSEQEKACYDFESCAPAEVVRTCYDSSPNGCVDWENGIIYAVGIGVPNPKYTSESQKNFSAVRAATVVGQRNLLEIVEGVNITSSTTVEMGMAQNDTVMSQVQGSIKRVQALGRPDFLNDGSVSIILRYYLTDLNSLLQDNNPYGSKKPRNKNSSQQKKSPYGSKKNKDKTGENNDSPTNKESQPSDGAYTGLIIDAKGLGVLPALSPKIYDENENLIYGVEHTGRNFNVSQGIVAYDKNLEQAKQNSRVAGNPLVVKATSLAGSDQIDVVLTKKDGEFLNQLYETQSFLREGRVLIVVD